MELILKELLFNIKAPHNTANPIHSATYHKRLTFYLFLIHSLLNFLTNTHEE